jgi:catechol 2,3-dioxygenase-like lactoylglutathione lyase family enzyme
VARLQHVAVTFPPGREDAIRDFYGRTLALSPTAVPPEVAHLGWIWFATDDEAVELHFVPSDLAPDPARQHHFCLEVDDLALMRRRLEEAGAPVSEPRSRILDRERLFVRDPVGNLVELIEYLPAGAGGSPIS